MEVLFLLFVSGNPESFPYTSGFPPSPHFFFFFFAGLDLSFGGPALRLCYALPHQGFPGGGSQLLLSYLALLLNLQVDCSVHSQ